MRYMMTYDLMETVRNTNQWLGASALALASYPIFAWFQIPRLRWMAAWGEVTERTFQRMVVKPDWGIRTFTCEDGKDHLVEIETVVEKPFGDLIHFKVTAARPSPRKVLLVAPMSGHYATLLRSTVKSLARRTAKSTSPTGTMPATFRSAPASSISRTTRSIWSISCATWAPTPM